MSHNILIQIIFNSTPIRELLEISSIEKQKIKTKKGSTLETRLSSSIWITLTVRFSLNQLLSNIRFHDPHSHVLDYLF